MFLLRICVISVLILFSISVNAQIEKTDYYNFKAPDFGNGDKAFMTYLNENLYVDSKSTQAPFKGRVIVKFLLTKEGTLSNFQVMDTTSSLVLNRRSLDLVKASTRYWKRATINGKYIDITIVASVVYSSQYLDTYRIVNSKQGGYNMVVDDIFINNFYNEGADLAALSEFSSALPYFDQVLSLASTDVDALYNRGVCHLKTDQSEKACEDWNKIKRLRRPDADALIQKYCEPKAE